MNPAVSPDATLAALVTDHPDLAPELDRRNLDYCCGGHRTLAEACAEQGLDPATLAAELSARLGAGPAPDWSRLGPAELVDHLVATHHRYLDAQLPWLSALLAKVESVHRARHPELGDVRATFEDLRADLEPHLQKEERVLFPMIRELAASTMAPRFHCGSLRNPISVMMAEHDRAGELLRTLRVQTRNYTIPDDACAAYAAAYRGLERLETDTHLHVHKENNLLFPAVVAMEDARAAAAR